MSNYLNSKSLWETGFSYGPIAVEHVSKQRSKTRCKIDKKFNTFYPSMFLPNIFPGRTFKFSNVQINWYKVKLKNHVNKKFLKIILFFFSDNLETHNKVALSSAY